MGILNNQLYSIMKSGLVCIFQATESNIDWFVPYIGVGPRFVYPEVIPASYFASTVALTMVLQSVLIL